MQRLKTGLVGRHISRTRFPAALKILCEHHGMTLEFELIDTAATPDFDLEAQLTQARAAGWGGIAVTHPFKARAAAWAGMAMAPEVAHLGAANTIVFGPPLRGENTDFTGFKAAYRGLASPPVPGRVVMMGAGGVARALAPAIMDMAAEGIWIHDSDMAAARALSARLGPRAHAVEGPALTDELEQATGLVNATPLGMAEHPGSAFAEGAFAGRDLEWAFDAVYTPIWTPFLSAARDRGLITLTGFDLFRHMAIRSFAALTAITPDAAAVLPLLDRLKPEVAHA